MKPRVLGELEQDVMEIVWNNPNSSISAILDGLRKKREIAYTTVATILQRLFDKGLVERTQTKGHYVYLPKLSKSEYSKKLIKNFLHTITNTFGDVAITSFAESIDSLPKKKKEYLLKLLQENENK